MGSSFYLIKRTQPGTPGPGHILTQVHPENILGAAWKERFELGCWLSHGRGGMAPSQAWPRCLEALPELWGHPTSAKEPESAQGAVSLLGNVLGSFSPRFLFGGDKVTSIQPRDCFQLSLL